MRKGIEKKELQGAREERGALIEREKNAKA